MMYVDGKGTIFPMKLKLEGNRLKKIPKKNILAKMQCI